MYYPLLQLIISRLKEFYREPAAIFWVYGFPMLLAVALGIAFRDRPVEKIYVDVVSDSASGQAQGDVVAALLAADPRIQVKISTLAEARNRLRTAKTALVVEPSTAGSSAWEYTLDANRPDCVLARSAVENMRLRMISSAANNMPAPTEKTIDEPGGRYIDFLIPGLLGTNLMGGGLFGVGFVIVDMRVRKLLKRFLATPMRKTDFLLSLMISRLLFMLSEVVVLLTFAYFVFGVRVHGNWLALSSIVFLGGVAFAGLGLLIASRAKTIETVSGLMNAVMLPMYVVSGVFFPSDRFPDLVQPIIQLLPLTVLIDAMRAIINEGAGYSTLGYPAIVLTFWAIGSFSLAFRLFRWR